MVEQPLTLEDFADALNRFDQTIAEFRQASRDRFNQTVAELCTPLPALLYCDRCDTHHPAARWCRGCGHGGTLYLIDGGAA